MFDFDKPQFNTQELLACIPGLNHETFKQWLKRGTLSLRASGEIGRGKRPQYPGMDVLQVATAYEVARNGAITLSKLMYLWPLVRGRAIAKSMPGPQPAEAVMFIHLHPSTSELMVMTVSEETEGADEALNSPDVPDMQVLFRVDHFISRMVRRMKRVKAGLPAEEPLAPPETGDFAVDEEGRTVLVGLTFEESEELVKLMAAADSLAKEQRRRLAELDFRHIEAKIYRNSQKPPQGDPMGTWAKDALGRDVLVGLTAEETEEFNRLSAKDMASRAVKDYWPYRTWDERDRESERESELHEKHERARLERLVRQQDGREND